MTIQTAQKDIPYTPEQIFDLVADVERYPEFLPWWSAVKIYKREGNVYHTDQVIRLGMIRERFPSKTVIQRPGKIDVTSHGGPFRQLNLHWTFDPLGPGGCRIGLCADITFHSKFLGNIFASAINRLVDRIIDAFEMRARRLYGPAVLENTTG